ncbi:hypothetical protein ABFS82_12G162000 [Erythranthe guttata]
MLPDTAINTHQETNPKRMANIILVVSVAALFSITTAAAASGQAPPLQPPGKPSRVEACVKLLFDPPVEASPSMRRTLCRDLLRTMVTSFAITGKLSPEYLAAIKKLPKFKDSPKSLEKFICGLYPGKKHECDGTKIQLILS